MNACEIQTQFITNSRQFHINFQRNVWNFIWNTLQWCHRSSNVFHVTDSSTVMQYNTKENIKTLHYFLSREESIGHCWILSQSASNAGILPCHGVNLICEWDTRHISYLIWKFVHNEINREVIIRQWKLDFATFFTADWWAVKNRPTVHPIICSHDFVSFCFLTVKEIWVDLIYLLRLLKVASRSFGIRIKSTSSNYPPTPPHTKPSPTPNPHTPTPPPTHPTHTHAHTYTHLQLNKWQNTNRVLISVGVLCIIMNL